MSEIKIINYSLLQIQYEDWSSPNQLCTFTRNASLIRKALNSKSQHVMYTQLMNISNIHNSITHERFIEDREMTTVTSSFGDILIFSKIIGSSSFLSYSEGLYWTFLSDTPLFQTIHSFEFKLCHDIAVEMYQNNGLIF